MGRGCGQTSSSRPKVIASGVVALCGIVMLVIDLASIPSSGGDSPVGALGVLGVPLVVLGGSPWSFVETAPRNARNRNLATELRTLSLAVGRTVSLEAPAN